MNTIDRLRDDEILALDHFIASTSPRTWKQDLKRAWEFGDYPHARDLDLDALKRLYRRMGPSVLSGFTAHQIQDEALTIARNLFALSTVARAQL